MKELTDLKDLGGEVGDTFGRYTIKTVINDGNYIFIEGGSGESDKHTQEVVNDSFLPFSGASSEIELVSLTVTKNGKFNIIGQTIYSDVDDCFPSLQLYLRRGIEKTLIGQDLIGQDLKGENVVSNLISNLFPASISIAYDLIVGDVLLLNGWHPIIDSDSLYANGSKLNIIEF